MLILLLMLPCTIHMQASDSAMAVSLITAAFPERIEYNVMDRSGYEPTSSTVQHSNKKGTRWQRYIEFRNASDVTSDMVVGSLEDVRLLSKGDAFVGAACSSFLRAAYLTAAFRLGYYPPLRSVDECQKSSIGSWYR